MKKNIILVVLLYFIINPSATYAAVCVDRLTNEVDSISPPCPPTHIQVAVINDFEIIFSSIVSIAGILIGFAFFIMVVIGGVRFLLSGGDPKALQAAKGTLTWGIIGLALFALSFTILLLIQIFTGVNVTIFRLSI